MTHMNRREAIAMMGAGGAGLLVSPTLADLIPSQLAGGITFSEAALKRAQAEASARMMSLGLSETESLALSDWMRSVSVHKTMARNTQTVESGNEIHVKSVNLDGMIADLRRANLDLAEIELSPKAREVLDRVADADVRDASRHIPSQFSSNSVAHDDAESQLRDALTKQRLLAVGVTQAEAEEILARMDSTGAWDKMNDVEIIAAGRSVSFKEWWSVKSNRTQFWYLVILVVLLLAFGSSYDIAYVLAFVLIFGFFALLALGAYAIANATGK